MALGARATNTQHQHTRCWGHSVNAPLPPTENSNSADPAALAIARKFGVSVTNSQSSTAQNSRSSSAAADLPSAASSSSHQMISASRCDSDRSRLKRIFAGWKNRVLIRRILVPGFRLTDANRHLIVPTVRPRHQSNSNSVLHSAAAPLASALSLHSVTHVFQRWMYLSLRHRNARECLPELLRLQRNANFSAVQSAFSRWVEGARNKRINTALAQLQMRCEGLLLARRLAVWMAYAAREKHRRAALRALSSSTYVSRCVLLARYWYKWTKFPAERARRQRSAEQLATLNHKRYVALTLWRWQRRLRFPHLLENELRQMRARARVVLMKRCLELWMRWSCRRMTAVMLEQRNLRRLLKVYHRKWRRHTHRQRVALPTLALVKTTAERRLQVRTFRKWVGWVERSVLSLSLEQKTLILILQRYFVQWRDRHDGSSASTARRSVSSSSSGAGTTPASGYSSPPPLDAPHSPPPRLQPPEPTQNNFVDPSAFSSAVELESLSQQHCRHFHDNRSSSGGARALSVQEVEDL